MIVTVQAISFCFTRFLLTILRQLHMSEAFVRLDLNMNN